MLNSLRDPNSSTTSKLDDGSEGLVGKELFSFLKVEQKLVGFLLIFKNATF